MRVIRRGGGPRPKRINTLFDGMLQTDSAGLIGRDHPQGALCIKQRGSRIREVGFFSPYYDTIGGLLYNDAFDGWRVRADAFLLFLADPVTRMVFRISKLRLPRQGQGSDGSSVRRAHGRLIDIAARLRWHAGSFTANPESDGRRPPASLVSPPCRGRQTVSWNRSSALVIEVLSADPTQGWEVPSISSVRDE